VKAELQAVPAGAVVEDGVDQGHHGRFQINIVSVGASWTVQVIDDALQRNDLVHFKLIVLFNFKKISLKF